MDIRKAKIEDIELNLLDLYIDGFMYHYNGRPDVFLDKDERTLKDDLINTINNSNIEIIIYIFSKEKHYDKTVIFILFALFLITTQKSPPEKRVGTFLYYVNLISVCDLSFIKRYKCYINLQIFCLKGCVIFVIIAMINALHKHFTIVYSIRQSVS